MTGHPRASVRRRTAAVALALGVIAGCAPHHVAPPVLDVSARRAAYLRALDAREHPAALIESDLTVWVKARGANRLGASGSVILAPPDAVRLKLDSMFGTAFDLAARGDSLTAVIPSKRMAVAADATRDTLGLSAPGARVYRMISGAWRPPSDARWEAGRDDGTMQVRWAEGPDSASLAVDRAGLPSRLEWRTADAGRWILEYLSWTHDGDVAWPEAIRAQDGRSRVTLTTRAQRLRMQPQPNPARLAVRVPPQTEWMDWRRFRDRLEDFDTWLP